MTDLEYGIKPPVDVTNPNYYLDKEQMREALREHRAKMLEAEQNGTEPPQISEYLGECFLNISKGLGMKHNFRRYSFIQDMVMDGVIKCLKGVKSFNPDMVSERTGKLVSPLGYFTQVCFFEFLKRIKEEEEESNVKWALLLKADIDSYVTSDDDAEDFHMNMSEFIKALGPQKHVEPKAKKKPQPAASSPLDEV
jgi:hypothetical protein